MLFSILIASLVPLTFLLIVHWLDFFGTHRASLLYIALAWGAFSVLLSYLVDHPLVPIVGRPFVGVRIGPAVEEIFKSLVLLYLVRRADYSYFVDGAIYGFAAGIGFAVAENMLYLSRVDVDTGIIVSISRAFSASVMHGGSTALVGIVVGGFPLARALHPLLAWVVGLALAIAYHTAYNRIAFESLGTRGLWILLAIALGGLAVIVLAIRWGLRRERRRVRKALGLRSGVARGEAHLIQHVEDLDDMLAPVGARFGEAKRDEVAEVLLMAAQLAIKETQLRGTRDRELQVELAGEVATMRRALRERRRRVGMYVMSYVRSVVPHARWSIYARLGHALARSPGAAASSLWTTLGGRVGTRPRDASTMHDHVTRALAAPHSD